MNNYYLKHKEGVSWLARKEKKRMTLAYWLIVGYMAIIAGGYIWLWMVK